MEKVYHSSPNKASKRKTPVECAVSNGSASGWRLASTDRR